MPPLAALALLSVLALRAPAAAPAPRDHGQPPDGAPADQQLWRDLHAASNETVLHMARIAQCSYRLTYGKYYQGLDAIAGDESARDRGEARSLRAGIEAAARAADEALPEQPGVRECRYVLRDLDLYMPLATAEPRAAEALEEARSEGRRCVHRLAPLAGALKTHADALEAALAAADAFAARRGTPLVTLGAAPAEPDAPGAPDAGGPAPGEGHPPAASPGAARTEAP